MLCGTAKALGHRGCAVILGEMSMQNAVLTLSVALIFTGVVAHAQGMVTDVDGSGGYSLAELKAVFPAMSETDFVAADTNHNGEVSLEELAAAVESGKIPS